MALKSTSDENPSPGESTRPGLVHAQAMSIQELLESDLPVRSDPGAAAGLTDADPVAALAALEVDGRFRRDTGLGRIFHLGSFSLREAERESSLHISITGNRISAHVDKLSPLSRPPQGPARYSLRSIVAHNLAGIAEDLGRLVRGRQGHHRSQLDCEWFWPDAAAMAVAGVREVAEDPAGVQLEAGIERHLDEARLRRALAGVLGIEVVDVLLVVVECPDQEAEAQVREKFQHVEVPLTDGPPLRCLLARRPIGDLFMLNINHAAADGRGALHVLETIARAYAGVDDPPVRLEFLASSNLPVRPAAASASKGMRGYRAAMEKVRDLLSPPARMTSEGSRDESGFGFHHVCLSAEDTRALLERKGPGTEDEALLGALHLAVDAWNTAHGARSGQISVLITDDLRPHNWARHLIGNFSITARVSTDRDERSDAAAAVAAVSAETYRNQRNNRARGLIQGLHRAGLLGLWAKQSTIVLLPLSGNRLVDTALVCNLGQFADHDWFGLEAGSVTETWFSTPPRAPVGLSVGAVTVGGRLHLSFRYRHRLLGSDAAARFAECYVAQLRQLGMS